MGRLVEVLRGATYEEVLRDRLADPLGIDEIAFSADQALAFRTAIGHVRPGDGFPLRPTHHWAVMPPSNPAAGNQLAMSARALLAVARLFVSAGRAPDGSQILSAASVELMLQPQLEHPGGLLEPTHQGLGGWLTRPGFAEHTGGSLGIASVLRVAPDHGLAAVVLTNADAGARLMNQLLDPLFTDLTGVPPKADLIPPPPAVRAPRPERFVGRYATRQRHSVVAQDDDGRLWLTSRPRQESEAMASLAGVPTSTDRYELRHLHDESFVRVGADERARGTVTFTDPDAGGRFRFLMADRAAPRLD